VRLEKKSADGVVGRADHALSLAVLGGGIQARHPQLYPVGEEEVAGGGVIELPTIVTLNDLNVRPNWVDTQAKKWRRAGKVSDLARKGKVHT
jgi:hypothetical protein